MKIRLTIDIPEWADRILSRPAVWYRKWRHEYTYRRIALTEGKFALVDEDDYYRYNNYGWCAKTSLGHTYAIRFIDTSKRGAAMLSMHREIMQAPAGLLVDHRNRNTLDNRRENLRLATRSQNSCNSRIDKSKATSQFRGVQYWKRRGRWVAKIKHKGKETWLGSFDNEIDAARAYDDAAKKYHGEFARLNLPDEIGLSAARCRKTLP